MKRKKFYIVASNGKNGFKRSILNPHPNNLTDHLGYFESREDAIKALNEGVENCLVHETFKYAIVEIVEPETVEVLIRKSKKRFK